MKKVKLPAVSGSFYPDNEKELQNMINNFNFGGITPENFSTRAVIVPHAGLIYSGALAKKGITLLDKNIKRFFIFAPAHKKAIETLGLTTYDYWKTPLGEIEIDKNISDEIHKKFSAKYEDDALKEEHSIEIQIPFIQTYFQNIKIVPILVGGASYKIISDIIKKYYKDKENGFIISSDLSHFLRYEEANKIDNYTAQIIENGEIGNFSHQNACGATGILGLRDFALNSNFSLIRLGLMNSGDVIQDKTRVVGYGAWALFEGEKNEYIKKYYSKFMLDLCKCAIQKKDFELEYDCVFDEKGASFVTLKKRGMLRGCIGSIIAHKRLIEDLISNSMHSAYSDPRFKPVQKEEIEELKISISLLSEPLKINFENEEDLLNKLVPNVDGVIIKDMNYQAVYLPVVWQDLPDKKQFLNSLKVKAGLNPNYFSKSFQAYRFKALYIEE